MGKSSSVTSRRQGDPSAALLERLRDTGTYFTFNRLLLKIMSADEALIYQHLLNVSSYRRAWQDGDGYFQHTAKDLEEAMGYNVDAQKRILRSMKEKKYIEIDRKGVPAKRQIRVEVVRVEALLLKAASAQKGGKTSRPVGEKVRRPDGEKTPHLGGEKVHQLYVKKDTTVSSLKEEELTKRERVAAPSRAKARSLPAAPPSEESLFPQDTQETPPPETWAARCARVLHGVVTEKFNVRRAWSAAHWSRPFVSLSRDWGEEVVEATLAWYAERGWPQWKVLSAAAFARWFEVIYQKWERASGRASADPTPGRHDADPAPADPLVATIARSLSESLPWPKGSAAGLPRAVAETLPEIKKFIKALWEVQRAGRAGELGGRGRQIADVAQAVRSEFPHDPGEATEWWWRRVNSSVRDWQGWSGDLSAGRFGLNGKTLQRIISEQVRAYTGTDDQKLQAVLVEEIEARMTP